jgi:hypothetical protein
MEKGGNRVALCARAYASPDDAQRPRFAAPHAQRSELKASVNNALLGLKTVLL